MTSVSRCIFQLLALIKKHEIALFATLLVTVVALICLQSIEDSIKNAAKSGSNSNQSFARNVLSTPGRMLSSLRGAIRVDTYLQKRTEESRVNQEFRNVDQTNKNASYFLRAVRKNDVHLLETLRPLVDSSLDVDLALRQAVLSDSLDSVMFLVRKMGANVNSENSYALRWSVRKGNVRMTKFLMNAGANMDAESGYSILQDAILHRYTDIAQLLQEYLPPAMFSDPNYPRDKLPSVYERVLCAVQEQHVETIQTLHGGGCRLDFCDNAPWRLAASLNHAIDLIVFFHGVAHFDLDLCGGILLLNAIRRGDVDMVSFCVDHGTKITDEAMLIARIHGETADDPRIINLLGRKRDNVPLESMANSGNVSQHDESVLSGIDFDVNDVSFASFDGDLSGIMPTNLSKELEHSKTPPPSTGRMKKGYRPRRKSLFQSAVFDSPAGKKELRYGVLTRSQRKGLIEQGVLKSGVLPAPGGSLFS